MNKSELIEHIAKQADISKAAAARALEAVIGGVKTTLKKNNTVSLVGFGTFSVGKRAARSGRNPRTGATIKIKAAKVPKFRPGKALKDAVRGQCSDWKPVDLREGRLDTECVRREADRVTVRLTGVVRLEGSGRAYSAALHGRAVYDTRARRFVAFELVAAGQRSGRDQFNFRTDDPGPAPMGVAFTPHQPPESKEPRK